MGAEHVAREMIEEHSGVLAELRNQADLIEEIGEKVSEAVQRGSLVMICGNGGSASQADHFAGELVGGFRTERRPLAALALNANQAGVTAIGNDYGFDAIFARQVEAFGKPGDVLIALSTSGESPNVLKAVERASERGMLTIALTGKDGGRLAPMCDLSLIVNSPSTARIQEMHILAIHIICEVMDRKISSRD